MTNKIIIASGGTGGHIFPSIAVAKRLEELGYEVIYFTDVRGLKYLSEEKNQKIVLNVQGLSGGLINKIKSLFLIAISIFKTLWLVRKIKPKFIIGFGGYASFSTLMAGIILRKKTIIHEQNAVLGEANEFLAKFVDKILISFPIQEKLMKKFVKKIYFTGIPLRAEILQIKRDKVNYDALKILITGGSQATKAFNKIIPLAIISLSKKIKTKIEVHHQAREEDVKEIEGLYINNHINAVVKSFFYNINQLLEEDSLLIGRSGASTIAEVAYTKIPAILVPLKNSKRNHQLENAYSFQKTCINGEFIRIIQEDNFSVESLTKVLEEFIENHNQPLSIDAKKEDILGRLIDIVLA